MNSTRLKTEVVRAQLEHDEKLAERLAALAMADLQVRERVDALNSQAIPARVYKLLEETDEPTNVVSLSRWKMLKNTVQEHVAVAASVALMDRFWVGLVDIGTNNWHRRHRDCRGARNTAKW